jgi:hypothetical protein
MSTFERGEYKWRETYFVLFESSKRPSLQAMQEMLRELNGRFQLIDAVADADGRFESITVLSPDDYAALDISYTAGEEVHEQVAMLEEEFKGNPLDAEEKRRLARLKGFDAKLDLLHFEQTADDGGGEDDDEDEMLDPSALLIVLDAVVELTDGVGVDPQSGTLI